MVMKTTKRLFDFYLNSSIHVALAVTAFAAITMINLRLEIDSDLLFFIFFSTIIGYNITKYTGSHESGESPQPLTSSLIIFSLICLLPLIYFTFTQPLSVIIISGIMGLITIFYSWPLFLNRSNLRDITGLKIFVIAIVWSTVTVILPVLSVDIEKLTNINFLIEFVQRLVFVVALTIPFDIRDIRFDTHQLGTIPQMIGIKQSRILGVMMLTLVVLCEFLKTPLLLDQAFILAGICSFTGFLIMQSVVKQTEYYASFWVESIPVIWYVLLIVF